MAGAGRMWAMVRNGEGLVRHGSITRAGYELVARVAEGV